MIRDKSRRWKQARRSLPLPPGIPPAAAAFFGYPGPTVKDRGERKGTVDYK